ncbi:hypothetical protein LguiB_006590 [Lonicera macranthoides]
MADSIAIDSEERQPPSNSVQEEGDSKSATAEEQKEKEEARVVRSRREKRKAAKKEKRKQIRKELAEKARAEEETRLNDPEDQLRIQLEEEREKERLDRERKEFEERERLFLEEIARKKAEEEEEQRKFLEEESKQNQANLENESNEDDDWEYVEEGPPEIIWQGNEIIVKKKRVKVKKKIVDDQPNKEDADRPISNPLPPQSETFADYKSTPIVSAQQLLDNVAQQVPNFGTEQDKAHCPFHIKTGACRFGSRCSRVHFYPDKSCTLLFKNMYNGPGLAWEQDEGLEVCKMKSTVILTSSQDSLRWRFTVLALVWLETNDISKSVSYMLQFECHYSRTFPLSMY